MFQSAPPFNLGGQAIKADRGSGEDKPAVTGRGNFSFAASLLTNFDRHDYCSRFSPIPLWPER